MSSLRLYSYYRSSCSYRVRIALYYKKISFEIIPVNLIKDQQQTSDYLRKNFMGQVPTLMDGEQVLSQSMAILFYLEEMYAKPPLWPFKNKSLCVELCEIINSGTQPLQNLSVLKKIQSLQSDMTKEKWGAFWIEKGLESFQKTLLSRASPKGKFCLGDTLSFADLFLIPQLYNARRFQIDLSGFQKLLDIEKECLQLDAFQKALPENQEDAP